MDDFEGSYGRFSKKRHFFWDTVYLFVYLSNNKLAFTGTDDIHDSWAGIQEYKTGTRSLACRTKLPEQLRLIQYITQDALNNE